MRLFDRIVLVISSSINALLDRGEARDPEQMLNQILLDLQGKFQGAKNQLALVIADSNRLRDQVEGEIREAAAWESRAVLAVEQGRDDLARQALVRQAEHQARAGALQATWTQSVAEVDRIKSAVREMGDRIEEARRKKGLLVARHRHTAIRAQLQSGGTVNGESAFAAFDRMEERVGQAERQLAAHAEVDQALGTGSGGDSLTQAFKALERGATGSGVEARLAELKARAALGTSGTRLLPKAGGAA